VNAGQADRERDAGGYSRMPTRNPVTARDILTPLFFFKRRVVLAFLVPILAALIAAVLAHPVFVAESRLLILLGDDYVFKSPLGAAMPGLTFDRSQIVHAETEILNSRELGTETIQAIGVERMYPRLHGALKLQAAAEQFQKDLAVEDIPQSNVLKISLRNGDREVAAQALNKLVSLYLDRRRGIFEQTNQSSVDGEMKTIDQQLAQVEAQLAAFSSAHGFGDFQLEFNGVQTQQIALANDIHNIDQQLAERGGRTSLLAQRGAAIPAQTDLSTDLIRSQQIDALTQSLVSLQTQRREAGAEYVATSPILAELDRRIAKVQADLAGAPTQQVSAQRRGVNPVHQDIDTQLTSAEADAAGLRQGKLQAETALKQLNTRLAELVALGPEYRQLMRTRELLENAASELAKRSQETRLANTLSGSQANVRVVQKATPPISSHTGRPVILLSGLVVGLIAAAGVTVLSVALFQAMLTPNDVEQKLAVPVVLAISSDPSADRPSPERGLPSPMYLTPDDVKVLGHLVRSIAPGGHSSLQMIGPTDGVGVSSLLVDYALLAARERQKVLLLDLEPLPGHSAADLLTRRGAILNPLGADGAVARVGDSNLYVTPPDQHHDLTMGERDWTRLLNQACKEYDLVLIDAPPLSRSWLGLFAAPSVDVTLAVIEAEESRAAVALNMVERIGGVGGVVAAAILNKRRFYIPKAVYSRL
jgi:succinoglycan biosynthesis transport protein ExoP